MASLDLAQRRIDFMLKVLAHNANVRTNILINEYKLRSYDLTEKQREFIEWEIRMDKQAFHTYNGLIN